MVGYKTSPVQYNQRWSIERAASVIQICITDDNINKWTCLFCLVQCVSTLPAAHLHLVAYSTNVVVSLPQGCQAGFAQLDAIFSGALTYPSWTTPVSYQTLEWPCLVMLTSISTSDGQVSPTAWKLFLIGQHPNQHMLIKLVWFFSYCGSITIKIWNQNLK